MCQGRWASMHACMCQGRWANVCKYGPGQVGQYRMQLCMHAWVHVLGQVGQYACMHVPEQVSQYAYMHVPG